VLSSIRAKAELCHHLISQKWGGGMNNEINSKKRDSLQRAVEFMP
jgi:hypothetical protein